MGVQTICPFLYGRYVKQTIAKLSEFFTIENATLQCMYDNNSVML